MLLTVESRSGTFGHTVESSHTMYKLKANYTSAGYIKRHIVIMSAKQIV